MTDSEKTVRALFCAFNKLTAARGTMDAWNFFPVADFDTGSNLCRTMKAGVEAIKRDESLSVCDLLARTAKSMLRFSKGNAGAILAALFKGFSEEVALQGGLNSAGLAAAFARALERARVLLPVPVTERTMLGLVQACGAAATFSADEPLSAAWKTLADAARRYLTADDLPPDAGALGLSLIFDGISDFLNDDGGSRPISDGTVIFQKRSADTAYAYAVALTVLTKADLPPAALERRLRDLGEAVSVRRSGDTFSAALITNQPDRVLSAAMRFGNLTDISIENLFYAGTNR